MGSHQCAAPDCRNTVPVRAGGRPASYCSDACRYRTRDRRRRALAKAAGTPGRSWRPPESWRPDEDEDDGWDGNQDPDADDGWDDDQDPDADDGRDDDQDPDADDGWDGEDPGDPAAVTTHADVALALAGAIAAFLPAVRGRARGRAGPPEIVITPNQVTGPRPAPGRELDRRPQFPARRPGREPGVTEVDGVAVSAWPRTWRSCEGCHVRTGTTRCEKAVYRVLISDPQEFGLPPMIDVCPQCHADLQRAGRILEPPARLPPSR